MIIVAKVIGEWRPVKSELCVLYLEGEIPNKRYFQYKIDGKIYNYVPISAAGSKCIAIKGEGSFVGKEVEFI